MRRFVSLVLRRLGWLRFDFLVSRVSRHPGKTVIPPGELWLVVDGGTKKWVCMSCPGGCGVQISLSLNPDRRPRWSIESDFWGASDSFAFDTSADDVPMPFLDQEGIDRMVQVVG